MERIGNEYEAYVTPTKGETKLNVIENAVAMLGQVQSHLANVEGQLKTKIDEVSQLRKDLAQERGLRGGARALYIYLSGRIENREPQAGPSGVASRVSFEELESPLPGSLRGTSQDYWAAQSFAHRRRDFRLMRTIGKLHVYEEV